MKHWIAKAVMSCFVVACVAIAVPRAEAARVESYNQIWFDSSGNVIGQHAEFCNNVQYEGGSQTGQFSLVVRAGCGDQLRQCSTVGTEYRCTGYIINNALTATVTGNSGGLTAGELCELAGACLGFEVDLMYGYGFPITQIYP
ncbi:hypothetical protein ACODUL_14205 [Stenotrophomonas maltophilia]